MSTVEIPPGRAVAGCAACEEVFTCVSAFDKHQSHTDPETGEYRTICHDPEEAGLVMYERNVKGEIWTLWGWPAAAAEDDDWYASE